MRSDRLKSIDLFKSHFRNHPGDFRKFEKTSVRVLLVAVLVCDRLDILSLSLSFPLYLSSSGHGCPQIVGRLIIGEGPWGTCPVSSPFRPFSVWSGARQGSAL